MSSLEAHACRIDGFCKMHDWDVTYQEIADALGLTVAVVSSTITAKGWAGRIGTKGLRKASALRHHRMGHDIDINTLDLCELIGP